MAQQIGTLATRMREAMPNTGTLRHTERCWMEHPSCALQAITRAASQVIADSGRR